MRKRKIVITIIAFIIIEVISFLVIENSHNKGLNQYFKKNTLEFEVKYKAVQNTYTLMTETILTQVINKPKILKLYSKAYSADNKQKQIIRDSLYNILLPVYNHLRSNNIKQLHFHLPNNESFLRFHRPKKNGDDLTNFRYSVKMTNLTKRKHMGFEEGRIFNGFRYVFPLFCENKHIGSVETSFSFNAINTQLKQHENNIYGFMLKKDLVKEKVFNTEKCNYMKSLLSDDYMHEKKYIHYSDDTLNVIKQIDKIIKPLIAEELAENENFTVCQKINNNYYLISFVSINNVEGKPVAYIFSYKKDNIIAYLRHQYKIKQILSLLVFAVIAFIVVLILIKSERAKEIDRDYKHILDANTDVIFMLDITGKQLFFNKQVESLLGYNRKDIIGKPFTELISPSELPKSNKILKEIFLKEQISTFESYAQHKDGHLIPVEITGKTIKYKGEIVGVGTIRDITDRKKIEQEIQEQNKQLKELNVTKDKFFSIIAHDLKSPFNVMFGFSELLMKKFDKIDVQKQKKFISNINDSIHNTYKLLENLLLWSRTQRGVLDFNPEPENLYLISVETIELLSQSAASKSISINNEISEDLFVKADKNMLSTILRNLISNAIKFTHKGGEIIIEAQLRNDENKQDFIEISVIDNGVGIKPEIQSKLFSISENISTKGTENESGTGLGLILCKEFVEKHGGEIWVESEVENLPAGKAGGSKFIFTIPAVY